MAKPLVQVEGKDDLIAKLKAIIKIVNKEMGRINRENAYRGLDRALALVPYKTGALSDSLQVKGGGTTWRFGSYGREQTDRRTFAMVALWVEKGTTRTDPHPYLGPASEYARSLIPKDARAFAHDLPFVIKHTS